VAFVCVTDPEGMPLHFGIFHPNLWEVYAESQRDVMAERRLDIDRQDMVDISHNLIVRTAWVRPASAQVPEAVAGEEIAGGGEEEGVHGAVVLGLRTEGLGMTVARFQLVQAGAVAAVSLACLALMPWLTRRWTGPMRELVAATQRLAQGKPPEPVTLTTNDEVGYLAGAFNDMAAKLLAGRRALMEANQRLEERVKERTRQLQDAVQNLDEMASNDDLTGVANRRAFTNALGRHFDAAVRAEHDLACVMIDLDGFKPVNDTLGHQAGDDLLVAVGRVLKSNSRSYDMPARLGGDEFVLLLPRTDEDTAKQIIERLFEEFQEEAAQLIGDPAMVAKVSMSVGLSSLMGGHPKTAEELLHQADQALYVAKDSGKAHMRTYDASLAA
jgi:diguanylate cyclase (GGDEF)-like protein